MVTSSAMDRSAEIVLTDIKNGLARRGAIKKARNIN